MAEPWESEKIEQFASLVSECGLHNRNAAIEWRKWALASCLSLNGGGAVAVLNLLKIDENSQIWAVIWFVVGLIASVVYGFAAAAMMSTWGDFFLRSSWTIKKRTFEYPNSEKLDVDYFNKMSKSDSRIQWIQYLSLLVFLVGLGVAIEGLHRSKTLRELKPPCAQIACRPSQVGG